MLQAQSNPALRQQQQRLADLALSRAETMPGGFNALRQMYETMQAPLEESMMDGANDNNTSASRNSSNSHAGSSGQAMPNPWGNTISSLNSNRNTSQPNHPRTSSTPGVHSDPNGMLSLLGNGSGDSNPFAAAGNPFGEMPLVSGQIPRDQQEAILTMMERDPRMQEMMDQMMAQNPGMVREILQANPIAASMTQNMTDEQLAQMMRSTMNPTTLRSMMQMQQQMGGIAGTDRGSDGLNPWMMGSGAPSNALDFSSLLGTPVPGLPNHWALNTEQTQPQQRYVRQLQQMSDMGFDDEAAAIAALQSAHGNLNRAVDLLLTESVREGRAVNGVTGGQFPVPSDINTENSEESKSDNGPDVVKDSQDKKND